MAGLKIVTDEAGFHRSKRDISKLRDRLEILMDIEALDSDTLKRVYHMLLLIFSNQAVIMDALGELQEGQGNTMTALDDLTDAVNSAVGIEQAAVNLLATLEGQVATLEAELAAAGTPVDDSAALSALKDTLTGGAQQLSDAINAAGGLGGSGATTTVPPTDSTGSTDTGTDTPPPSTTPVDDGSTPAPTSGDAPVDSLPTDGAVTDGS